jgi:hypothetical protein
MIYLPRGRFRSERRLRLPPRLRSGAASFRYLFDVSSLGMLIGSGSEDSAVISQ